MEDYVFRETDFVKFSYFDKMLVHMKSNSKCKKRSSEHGLLVQMAALLTKAKKILYITWIKYCSL
jgi:hypothetical protein